MKKTILLLLLLLLVGCSNDTPNNESNPTTDSVVEEVKDTVALVNGEKISVETFKKYYAMQSYDFEKEYGESVWNIEQDGKTMKEIRQEQTIDYLIRVSLIEKYVLDKGITVDESAIEEAYTKYMDSIKNDEEIQAYYTENGIDKEFLQGFLEDQYYLRLYDNVILDEVTNDPETQSMLFDDQYIRYKTRHILVDTEEKLNEVLAVLNDEENPMDFSDAARLYSIHSTSAVEGGDLGYRVIGNMPAAYEAVALTIEPYVASEPVETEYGYHIIFVDDRQMLKDMIEIGMPEAEINKYKSEIIRNFAASETVRIYNEMKDQASITTDLELLNEE